MSDLLERLSKETQKVELSRYESLADFNSALDRNYVLVNFTETQGGTELGFEIDRNQSEIYHEESDKPFLLVGRLTLNYVDVECHVKINKSDLKGEGILRVLN